MAQSDGERNIDRGGVRSERLRPARKGKSDIKGKVFRRRIQAGWIGRKWGTVVKT
jgi:hypothetical protein